MQSTCPSYVADSKYNPFYLGACIPLSQFDVSTMERLAKSTGNNSGNIYIGYSVIKMTAPKKIISSNCISNIFTYFSVPRDYNHLAKICNRHSHVILILQDFIRAPDFSYASDVLCDNLSRFLKKLKVPVVVFSLGANHRPGVKDIFDFNLHKKLSKSMLNFLNQLSFFLCFDL